MKFGLSASDIATIQEVIAQFPTVQRAVIFGSRAKGTASRGSDVDIALFGENIEDATSKIHYQLEEETLLPYFFDVLDYQQIENADLKAHIDRVGQVLFERQAQ